MSVEHLAEQVAELKSQLDTLKQDVSRVSKANDELRAQLKDLKARTGITDIA